MIHVDFRGNIKRIFKPHFNRTFVQNFIREQPIVYPGIEICQHKNTASIYLSLTNGLDDKSIINLENVSKSEIKFFKFNDLIISFVSVLLSFILALLRYIFNKAFKLPFQSPRCYSWFCFVFCF